MTNEYLIEFIDTYDKLFKLIPDEVVNFHHFSSVMRRQFVRMKRAIPLIHRNGGYYKITPHNGRMRRVDPHKLPKFGPYLIAERLPFPGE